MTPLDFFYDSLLDQYSFLRKISLCFLGLHKWGYIGQISLSGLEERHWWLCSDCSKEKFLKYTFSNTKEE